MLAFSASLEETLADLQVERKWTPMFNVQLWEWSWGGGGCEKLISSVELIWFYFRVVRKVRFRNTLQTAIER